MKIRVKTDAATEPVSVEAARDAARVDGTWSDTQLNSLIKAGRQAAEDFIKQSIPIQTLELALDGCLPDIVRLPKGPLVALKTITLTDISGTTISADTASFIVDRFDSRLVKKSGAVLPTVTLQETNGVLIEYQAGYETVPETIKEAILLYAQARFDCIPPADWMPSFHALLYPHKVVSI